MTDAHALRKNCFIMSISGAAPLDFWLSLPLRELWSWVEINNEVMQDQKKQ